MAERHWSDDDLVAHLYGLGPEDGHLEECAACGARWRRIVAARARVLQPPAVPEELLGLLRNAVYQGLERDHRGRGRMAWGSIAAAAVAVMAVLLSLPRPAPETPPQAADAELFSEVYSVAASTETLALDPIHALFEVEQ